MKKSIICVVVGMLFRALGSTVKVIGNIPLIGNALSSIVSPIINHANKISSGFFVLAVIFLAIHFISKFLAKRRKEKERKEMIQDAIVIASASSAASTGTGTAPDSSPHDINYF